MVKKLTPNTRALYSKRRKSSSCRGRALEMCKTRKCKATKATDKKPSYCRKSRNTRR
jgi:hypothetical protein